MTVRSVARALAILECFQGDCPNLALHQISAKLGLAKSTTYRLVSTLIGAGYLVQKENNAYCLSLQLLRLGGVVASNLEIAEIARAELLGVSAKCGETVEISMLTGSERVCVDVIESPSRSQSIVQVGEVFSLYYGATGMTFLAFMPDQVQAKLVRKAPQDVRNRRPLPADELALIKKRGYAMTSGQRIAGASAISAPIFDIRLEARYCMTITGPTARFSGREIEFAKLVTTACQNVSSKLGARR